MASDVGSDAGNGRPSRDRRSDPSDEPNDVQWSRRRTETRSGRATAESSTRPSLSVVVPTYNEEDRIETCLESVLAAVADDPSTEVIVVDSNSTDRTVELAREYPVTVLRIPDDDLTTPGAGRYVGHQRATGDQLLFVDGDMRISGEWLDRARRVLDQRDDVAGLDGHLNTAEATDPEPVEALRGVAIYDADVLDQVDGFDPFLRALEDVELGYRITEAGYDVRRLPIVAASHPCSPGAAELCRRWRNGYYFGLGQAVRKSVHSPRTVWKFVDRYRYRAVFYGWLAAGATSLLVQPALAVAWLAVSLVTFAADVAWEGHADATQRLGTYVLSSAGFVRGFFMPPPEHSAFPVEVAERVAEPDAVAESDGPKSRTPSRAE
ncbi:Glycosyltransferase, catalytic subunit of cellulose synthase and poly-beta-1,6-N-acetylglucosamine synthase [Halomicrobium zhouii]|uniref:Glycosyltransferase, catalytic subunit of cellulose synthase and poly-beta-1,6-N-acetylglucosamine synthase n=1 Tax=Halomicrobium zhouii TaxID=767519 RepID=A0A1I6K6J6_9EURY|nr:glycosyltransferase family 2 protein [Halomicrobium zhouii]SFR86816.1 Glycosyltransferase, catalytic subunit of cellulose synthase and poly-beta-1,6-N-acetylglucosamine synthase [Halomicrobium zhouii]